jgi:glycosyltransferase involved in cell wall biosynthesis
LSHAPLDIAVVLDSADENWPSMDLVGEMLLDRWRAVPSEVAPSVISLPVARVARRLAGDRRSAFNFDRAITRYLTYPLRAAAARRTGRLFHIADHSYAQIAYVLPSARTGVYCHDIDAFRAVLAPETERPEKRTAPFRALARTLLRGLRSAALIFYSTRAVGSVLEAHGLGQRSRLVHAPYGVSHEFTTESEATDLPLNVLAAVGGRPFVLHVGSSAPRKRLDVLFQTFARLRERRPQLRLIQQGAALSTDQQALVEKLRIGDALYQPPKLDRKTLASLYRLAAVVLVTSDAEGFGFPVLEALACGATVVASAIPPLLEVGEGAALYAPVGDINAWTEIVTAVLDGSLSAPSREQRLKRARNFSWEGHARTILDAYRSLVPCEDAGS